MDINFFVPQLDLSDDFRAMARIDTGVSRDQLGFARGKLKPHKVLVI